MHFITDRKRAEGFGSSKTGTEHFWSMTISSVALLVLTPLFLIAVAPVLGAPHDVVLAHFARPFPALVTGLTIVVGFVHFKDGVRVVIEDYTDGLMRKALIVGTTMLSYAAIAAGLLALGRMAL
ncbi:MAG TPA: succinate dehydrogenase, hydrophobic membrane anchor protein [Rhodobacteraceae bacterium]|jgi:succinate dehydrogenase / fumarate reductase membrane anchor subunit|nr:succinate dehydrogenase, hydrophobic membrane anchor protein [Paracoccaceae bacterium]HBG97615.1 succinate dehydrogenase, hydrophobic membrane anchor protein [Paracoccaceae bacterium]